MNWAGCSTHSEGLAQPGIESAKLAGGPGSGAEKERALLEDAESSSHFFFSPTRFEFVEQHSE